MEVNVVLRPLSLFCLNNLNCLANSTDTALVFQMEMMPFISWVESPVYPVVFLSSLNLVLLSTISPPAEDCCKEILKLTQCLDVITMSIWDS